MIEYASLNLSLTVSSLHFSASPHAGSPELISRRVWGPNQISLEAEAVVS